jgi:diacylglycerol kinase (ATP)
LNAPHLFEVKTSSRFSAALCLGGEVCYSRAAMRAAAIHGPGSSPKYVRLFQQVAGITWLTEFPAKQDDAEVVLIFGGDGTLHHALVKLAALQLPVLIVPCGSGNDFARALGLRSVKDALNAWFQFVAGRANVKRVDLGIVTPARNTNEVETPTSHYFCTVSGIGLDGEVARRANRLPSWLRARGGYVLSLLSALYHFAPVSVRFRSETDVRQSRIFLAAFANTPAYGGGMRIAPQAILDDGKLDICLVRELNKLKFCCLFPSVYSGRHLQVPEVDYFQTPLLAAESETPLDVFADGEFLCHTPVQISVAEKVLRMIVPA